MMGSFPFTINGALPLCSSHDHRSLTSLPVTIFKSQGLQQNEDVRFVKRRSRGQAFLVLANPNASSGKRSFNNEVIMVDPLEAKRLAAKEMQVIQEKERRRRQRQIEAINGAWAMIGLTAGLVIEGQTGNGFLAQLAGYWRLFISFFVQ
ncbi:uncharacterized protein LOC122074959 [Macadamia integrifolia]|uniref:uncharacterized protein LOC122074959 n=1 Tax=Macadamia integrifolia TaxID=60698 RepID=UPI001C4F04D9|nr:uncharacterized protein LOC122074959 [Macadamia integrifolia]